MSNNHVEKEKKEESPTYESLVEELAQQKALFIKAQLKAKKDNCTIDILTQQNEELKEQVRKFTKLIEQSEHAAQQTQLDTDRKLKETERELKILKVTERYRNVLRMDEKLAKRAAIAEVNKDMDNWKEIIASHIKKVKLEATERGMQDFLTGRPDIKCGNGPVKKDNAMVADYPAWTIEVNTDSLKQFQ